MNTVIKMSGSQHHSSAGEGRFSVVFGYNPRGRGNEPRISECGLLNIPTGFNAWPGNKAIMPSGRSGLAASGPLLRLV